MAALRDAIAGFPRRAVSGTGGVKLAFIAVHLLLGWEALFAVHHSMSDVTTVYRHWVETGLHTGAWVGIDRPFVYPVASLLPMLLAAAAGPTAFDLLWVIEVVALDAIAVSLLIRTQRGRVAAYYWLAAFLALGPVAIGRVDAIACALAMIAVAVIATRPRLAGALLALGAWVKFGPAAIVVAAVTAGWARRRVLTGALGLSAGVIGTAVLVFDSTKLFSFLGLQGSRGLQIEAPAATPLLWEALFRQRGAALVWSRHLLTWQIQGPHSHALAAAAGVALPLASLAVVALGVRAARAGVESRTVTALLALALTLAFCAFDKVGSPQYQSWFAVPIVLGILTIPRLVRLPALLVLASCALTQVIYPWHYHALVDLRPWMLVLISARNLLEFVVFGWAASALWRAARAPGALAPVPWRLFRVGAARRIV